jgi:hypothetical protein
LREITVRSAKRIGQIIGLLIFAQLACGLVVTFVLLRPITTPPGFLENAAGSSLQISVAVVLWFVTGALSIAIAITAWPVFRQYSSTMALWFLSLGVVSFSLLAVENATVMSMLSLSQAYAAVAAPDPELFKALGAVVRSAYIWTRNTSGLVGEAMILVLYCILYRFVLVPRALSAFGLVAVLLKVIAIMMPFFGHRVILLMVLPMVLGYLALALWLIARGFDERPYPLRPDAQGDAGLSGA